MGEPHSSSYLPECSDLTDGSSAVFGATCPAPRPTEPSAANPPHLAQSDGDPVHAPPHYTRYHPEPREVCMQWGLPWWMSNIIKYGLRAGHKVGPGESERDAWLRDMDKLIETARFARDWVAEHGRVPEDRP